MNTYTPDEIRELQRRAWEDGRRDAMDNHACEPLNRWANKDPINPYAPQKPTLEEWLAKMEMGCGHAKYLDPLLTLVRAGDTLRHEMAGVKLTVGCQAWDSALEKAGVRGG